MGAGTGMMRYTKHFAPAAALFLTGGCTTTIIPPSAPADPAPVFVLDHGRHTTLVLPHPGGAVRYAYGDWTWYAEADTGVGQGSSAVLVPTRGALGRRLLPGAATAQGVRDGLKVGVESMHRVEVGSAQAESLRSRLEHLYRANRPTRLENSAYDLTFVHHPEPYTAFHNSNHKVAEWLRRMGCRIEGGAMWADWRVEDQPAP